MRLIGRGTLRNIYLYGLLVLFLYTFEWNRVKRSLVNELDIFPDSGVIPGVHQAQRDWHDYKREAADRLRTGPGEQGKPYIIEAPLEAKRKALWDVNGFDALASDLISLDRALEDIRHPSCHSKKYSEHLPTVSVVIPFLEEHLSTLQRTVKSVLNKSPEELIREIILVDDGSSLKESLQGELESWIQSSAPKTHVIRLPERVGLIQARQEGAKVAKGDVILVLDSHVEVMNNWLPPLLDPIAADYRTVVSPLIDSISKHDFHYGIQDDGGRGVFDWRFFYKRLPLLPEQQANLPEPFQNPVMNGGLFAISRKFFWELGGYDLGIKIWGGEQYQLSFKIWQCGGQLLDAPCSRVGHIFRHPLGRPESKTADINVNYKRVMSVWMDDYAEDVYRRLPHIRDVDAGDITEELKIRSRLQCKPFKWFLETVAPDLTKYYPAMEPADFANGQISNMAAKNLCLDKGGGEYGDLLLYHCYSIPGNTQKFNLSWHQTLRSNCDQWCVEAKNSLGSAPLMYHCPLPGSEPSKMTWKYEVESKQLINMDHKWCLEADIADRKVRLENCDVDKLSQKWNFQHINPGYFLKKDVNS